MEVAAQAHGVGVDGRDGLAFVVEADDRGHRSEDLLGDDLRVRVDVDEYGWLEEEAGVEGLTAAGGDLRPGLHGSLVNAEICAGSGLDWILAEGEHAPLGLSEIQAQLQVLAAYPTTPVVRVPVNDWVHVRQFLDLGAQNLLVPMVHTAEETAQALENAEAIAATDGVDAIFIGPSDLAASMGLIGQQGHQFVVKGRGA